jgi:ferredoxin-NADP reductase
MLRSGTSEAHVPTASQILTLPVAAISRATPDALLVHVATEGRRFPFLPGQAVLLGVSGQPLRKPYSIAIDPGEAADRDLLEFLIVSPGPDGPGLHLERLAEGTLVDIEGPIGGFTLPPSASGSKTLFFAGGTGIAPLRSMLRDLLRKNPDRRPALVYSARTAHHLAYLEELETLATAGRLDLVVCLTREAPEGWGGHRGRIDRALIAPHVEQPASLALVCGPPGFVELVSLLIAGLGVPDWRILKEEW